MVHSCLFNRLISTRTQNIGEVTIPAATINGVAISENKSMSIVFSLVQQWFNGVGECFLIRVEWPNGVAHG